MAHQKGFVRLHDDDGQVRDVAWDTWVSEILPSEFQKAWDDPDRLFTLLHSTMRDGLFDSLLPAAKRLNDIDPDRIRCTSIYAAVLIHSDQFDIAEPLLNEQLESHGPSADILYHLAILHERRGNHTRAEETLLRALHVDPNHEEALDWWGAMQRVKGGEREFVEALESIAQMEGAWRAELQLAQQDVAKARLSEALQRYRTLLANFPGTPAIPMISSFDLGNAGYPEALISLLSEHFKPGEDDPLTGINMLQAYLVLERFAEAEKLLAELVELDEPEIHEDLLRYASQIRRHSQRPK